MVPKLTALLVASLLLFPGPVLAADAPDFPTGTPPGHWYTETNGYSAPEILGYGVFDYPQVKFWSEFQRLGGISVLGYPVSSEFLLDGFINQAFQKAILQWHPETGHVQFVNVFDQLHDAGKDGYLLSARQTPPPASTSGDTGKPWDQVVAAHQSLLAGNPAIKAAYFASTDPISQYGLPMTGPVDEGNVWVVRCQRAVFQQWKQAVPWAAAGQVTIANGGDIAKAAGLLPTYALGPYAPNFAFVSGGPIRKDAAAVSIHLSDLPPGYVVYDSTQREQFTGGPPMPAGAPPTPSTPSPSSPAATATPPATPATPRGMDPVYLDVLSHGLVNRQTVFFVNTVASNAAAIQTQTDVFRSVDGASWNYARRIAIMRGLGDQSVSIPALGDDSSGWVAHVTRSDGVPVTIYDVVFRAGNITVITLVYYDGGQANPGAINLALQLAQTAHAQIMSPS